MTDHTQERELNEDLDQWKRENSVIGGGTLLDRLFIAGWQAHAARRSIPQGDDPAKAAAQGDELPPLPEPRAIRAGHSFPKVYALAYTADQMREYGASCRAGSIDRQLTDAPSAVKQEAGCGKCPRDTPYGPGTCATCLAGEKADARDAVLEEAALACEAIEADRYDAYKGRGKWEPFNPGRADPYVNGESDGAGRCADAIRKLKSVDAALSAQKGGEDEGKGEGK